MISYQSSVSIDTFYNVSLVFFSLYSGTISSSQIQVASTFLSKLFKLYGGVRTYVFLSKPVSRKPIGVRIGKGKGATNFWVSNVKSGQFMFGINLNSVAIDFKKISVLLSKKLSIKVGYKLMQTIKVYKL
jgi:ribosomal protein L16/L10AE